MESQSVSPDRSFQSALGGKPTGQTVCPFYEEQRGDEGRCSARDSIVNINGGFCWDGRFKECDTYIVVAARRT